LIYVCLFHLLFELNSCSKNKENFTLGVVIRQSSISTVFTYIGVAIGYVNALWLFPAYLSTEQIGLIRILPAAAFLMLPLAQLGLSQSLVKFYPDLIDKKNGIAQLIGLLILGIIAGLMMFGVAFFLFHESIGETFLAKSKLILDYIHVIVCLVIIFSFQLLFEVYTRTLFKIVIPNLIKEVLIRVMTSIAVTLHFLDFITFSQLANGLIVIYLIALIVLLVYIKYLNALKVSFQFNAIDKVLFKKIANYSLFALLGSGGTYVLLNIDQIMITSMLGLSENGIYTTAFYIAVVIEMARRPISQISQPLISNSFKQNDITAIEKIYKQVSINQMIIGGLFYIGIVSNLDNLYALMPNSESFEIGKWVMIIVGAGKLIDMTFGINGEVIIMSNFYRFNVVTVILLALITIFFNYLLIPLYGMTGAAIATLLSMIIYNLIKMIFIKVKLKIVPFTWNNLIMLGIIMLILALGIYIPKIENTILDILIRSSVITFSFGTIVYLLRVSQEVNELTKKAFGIFRKG
jgi:O-antigen/teichoic acid export membrane protein